MFARSALGILVASWAAGCSEGETALPEDTVGEYYEGLVDIKDLNAVAVQDVGDDTTLTVEFYDCEGELCAEADVDGEIDTIAGDVDGDREIENIEVDEDVLRGEIIYEDWHFHVKGEFQSNKEELLVEIRLPAANLKIGEVLLSRVIVYEDEAQAEVE